MPTGMKHIPPGHRSTMFCRCASTLPPISSYTTVTIWENIKYEFLQNYDYLKTIEKRPSELTAADMKMVYYSLTDFSSQTKSPVIVFTSAPTLEKEHTLTLRWTTVEGDVKTASVTCTPEVDPALQ